MRIGFVLLAAGLGKRFGENKLLTPLCGRPLFEYVLSQLPLEAFADGVVVVSDADVREMAKSRGIRCVANDRPETGIGRSIRLGTRALGEVDACMYIVADQPLLRKGTIEAMALGYAPDSILSLAHDGKRGNPVIFPASLRGELATLEDREYGIKVIHAHMDLLRLYDIKDKAELMDVDTSGDLKRMVKLIAPANE